MKNKFYVYILLDPRKSGQYVYKNFCFDFEPFYIGKGCGRRIDHHCANSRLKDKTYKNCKIKKILSEGIKPIQIKLLENLTEKQAKLIEIKYIKMIGRKDLHKGPLCNHTDGGDGCVRHKVSNSTKLKISKALMGKFAGRKLTEEWKKKISQNNAKYWLGKKYSDARKKRMSKITKKQDFSWRCLSYEIISPTKKKYIVTYGLGKFCKIHNLSRSKMVSVSSGKRPHHKNWLCRKIIHDAIS